MTLELAADPYCARGRTGGERAHHPDIRFDPGLAGRRTADAHLREIAPARGDAGDGDDRHIFPARRSRILRDLDDGHGAGGFAQVGKKADREFAFEHQAVERGIFRVCCKFRRVAWRIDKTENGESTLVGSLCINFQQLLLLSSSFDVGWRAPGDQETVGWRAFEKVKGGGLIPARQGITNSRVRRNSFRMAAPGQLQRAACPTDGDTVLERWSRRDPVRACQDEDQYQEAAMDALFCDRQRFPGRQLWMEQVAPRRADGAQYRGARGFRPRRGHGSPERRYSNRHLYAKGSEGISDLNH